MGQGVGAKVGAKVGGTQALRVGGQGPGGEGEKSLY